MASGVPYDAHRGDLVYRLTNPPPLTPHQQLVVDNRIEGGPRRSPVTAGASRLVRVVERHNMPFGMGIRAVAVRHWLVRETATMPRATPARFTPLQLALGRTSIVLDVPRSVLKNPAGSSPKSAVSLPIKAARGL